MDDTAWPTIDEYSLAHRCSRCHAEPGEPCTIRTNRRSNFHAPRQDVGLRHYYRDLAKAPFPEDRVPGQRYDTLPR